MGRNTTVVVYGDALDAIAGDPEFGKNLAKAIGELEFKGNGRDGHVDVPASNHSNAAMVVETHHADSTAIVTVGGNLGICHVTRHGWDHNKPEGAERLLREWAEKLGYILTKREPCKPALD